MSMSWNFGGRKKKKKNSWSFLVRKVCTQWQVSSDFVLRGTVSALSEQFCILLIRKILHSPQEPPLFSVTLISTANYNSLCDVTKPWAATSHTHKLHSALNMHSDRHGICGTFHMLLLRGIFHMLWPVELIACVCLILRFPLYQMKLHGPYKLQGRVAKI